MSQEIFNWVWLALFIVIAPVRKVHERKAGHRVSLKDGWPRQLVVWVPQAQEALARIHANSAARP